MRVILVVLVVGFGCTSIPVPVDDEVPQTDFVVAADLMLPGIDAATHDLEKAIASFPPSMYEEFGSGYIRIWGDVIDRTANDLQRAIATASYSPLVDGEDLYGLRDYVSTTQRAAILGLATEGLVGPVPVSYSANLSVGKSLKDADELGRLVQEYLKSVLILRDRVRSKDLITRLCVITRPSGANLEMAPESRQDRVRATVADSIIENLTRGVYSYSIRMIGEVHRGKNLDLVTPDELTLICRTTSGGQFGCQEYARILEPCSQSNKLPAAKGGESDGSKIR